jgi:predicted enzyme related to lactoylglutathione lyase
VLVEPGAAGGPRLFFQRVPEAKSAKNRLHLDLHCDDVDGEIARVGELGGLVRASFDDHVVLADPEGNEFCLPR